MELCTLHLHAGQVRVTVEQLRSLLVSLCYVFQVLINSLVC